MDYERVLSFIRAYSRPDSSEVLSEIYRDAIRDGVPVIRTDMRDYMRTLLCMVRPKRILEIGTAVGYSACFMADTLLGCMDENYAKKRELDGAVHGGGTDTYESVQGDVVPGTECVPLRIDTCELEHDMVIRARENISRMGLCDYITVHEGDGERLLDDLCRIHEQDVGWQGYDLIFIDAAKAQYMSYLERAMRLSHMGTVIVSDNILQEGKILESHFLVEKRDRTIHDKMRRYLSYIMNSDKLESALLPVGDGAAVSVVKTL